MYSGIATHGMHMRMVLRDNKADISMDDASGPIQHVMLFVRSSLGTMKHLVCC